jgi:hypothetical protein
MELLAYHKWLLETSAKDRRHLAVLLYLDIVQDRNPMAFDLLKLTGDKEYNENSFLKAADILIIQSNKDEETK